MTLNLQLPAQQNALRPIITVVGVGGAGGNAVNNMISAQLEGVEFVVANTDAQALESALTEQSIQLGRNITQGLGAGATPEIGQAAAEEAAEEIARCIEGSNMVFITAGMGGGTGTGAAPVVARMAREQGMLTVGVVTKPFQFEGAKRMKIADQGIAELQKYVDTLIVIPNQNLFRIANEKTTFADAFRLADEVLHSGVRGVTDLMVKPGLVNLDFADIRTVMQEMGKAMMGTGEASGEKRAIEAAEAAISNPLLDDVSLKGARAALINITGGADMTLYEVDEAANRIREEIDVDANIIFGSTFHESMQGMMRVSVVATGIDVQDDKTQTAPAVATRNFSKPAMKQAPKPSAPQQTSAMRKTPVVTPVVAGNSAATQAAQTAAINQRTISSRQETQPVSQQQSSQQDYPAPSFIRKEQEQEQESKRTQDEQQAMDGLFVSPHPQQSVRPNDHYAANTDYPEQQARAQYAPERQQDTHYVPSNDAAYPQNEQTASFKILNKIADVKRSFNTRSEPAPRRSIEVSDNSTAQQPTQDNHYESQESTQNDDNYYEIPTFLRRQAN